MPKSPSSMVLFDLKGSDLSRSQTITATLDLFFSFKAVVSVSFTLFQFILFFI